MLKRNLSFVMVLIILILGLFGTNSVLGYNDYDYIQNMTSEEVLVLVKNNEEIISWLVSQTIDFETVWGWSGYWTVGLNTFNSTDYYYLEIIVNDFSQKIISINYYFDNYRTWELEQTIIESARTFLNDSGYQSIFAGYNEYLDFWIGEYGIIEIQGWGPNKYIRGQLAYSHLLNGTVNFHLISIWSDTSFGSASVSFSDALLLAENTSLFQNFDSNFTSNFPEIYMSQSLYFDTPYLQNSPGYVILVEKNIWTGDTTLEFVNGVFVETINYNYDKFDTNFIWIDNNHQVRAWINGSDGTIIDLSKNYLDPGSYANLANLALQDPEVLELVNGMRKFNGNFYHNYKDIFTLSIYSEFSVAWVEIKINATSGEIINKNINIPISATRTESEIVSIAFQNYDIIVLLENLIEFDYWVYYDFAGTWRLEFYDKIMVDGSGYIEIDDTSGEVLYSDSWYVQPPNLIVSEVIDIALNADLSQFYQDYPDARISMFFDWDRNWQVFVYDPIYVNSYHKITVDDYSKEITNINYQGYSTLTQNSVDDIRAYLLTLDEYKEFENLTGDKYEYIYFKDDWTVYLENIDSDKVLTQLYLYISDSSLQVSGGFGYDQWSSNWNYKRVGPGELNDMFEYDWGFERLDRIPYTNLGDVIEGFVPSTSIGTSNDKTTQSLGLPSFRFGISISILFITTIVVRKYK